MSQIKAKDTCVDTVGGRKGGLMLQASSEGWDTLPENVRFKIEVSST